MQGGSGWDDAVTPGKEKGAGPGARGGDAETPGGDGYHGGDAVGPGGAPGAPGYSPAYGRSPGFSPQGEPMGRDMPEVTAMAIADAISAEIAVHSRQKAVEEARDKLELLMAKVMVALKVVSLAEQAMAEAVASSQAPPGPGSWGFFPPFG